MKRKKNKGGARKSLLTIGTYSALDEMLASNVAPFPDGYFEGRFEQARESVGRLGSGVGTHMDLGVICGIGLTMRILLDRGNADDPDGLLADALSGLHRFMCASDPAANEFALPPALLADITDMMDGWQAMLISLPARAVISADREGDRITFNLKARKLRLETLLSAPIKVAA